MGRLERRIDWSSCSQSDNPTNLPYDREEAACFTVAEPSRFLLRALSSPRAHGSDSGPVRRPQAASPRPCSAARELASAVAEGAPLHAVLERKEVSASHRSAFQKLAVLSVHRRRYAQ